PDGSFHMKLPEGEYRVIAPPAGANNAIPTAYVLRALTFGPADLFRETMTVSSKLSLELQASFGTTAPNPWSRVAGKVVGTDSAQGPFRVALESPATTSIEAIVNPDGTFEFPRVLQSTNYTARLQ